MYLLKQIKEQIQLDTLKRNDRRETLVETIDLVSWGYLVKTWGDRSVPPSKWPPTIELYQLGSTARIWRGRANGMDYLMWWICCQMFTVQSLFTCTHKTCYMQYRLEVETGLASGKGGPNCWLTTGVPGGWPPGGCKGALPPCVGKFGTIWRILFANIILENLLIFFQ